MKVGVTLPTFTPDASKALDAARAAEAGGLDGVFVFDHLWPMGSPGRPALWSFSVLGAVAARTDAVQIGTLVARIDLMPEEALLETFATLDTIAGAGRLIAGIGAGDRLSAAENAAYGLPHPPAAERLAAIGRVADRLRPRGVTVWVGGTSEATAALARDHAVAHNRWGVPSVQPGETWGGQVLVGKPTDREGVISGSVEAVAVALQNLGADYCVCAPLDYIEDPLCAVETICRVAEAVR